MPDRDLTADCLSCESTYNIQYSTEMTSEETPLSCPFCGEVIEDYIDDEQEEEDDGWDEEINYE
jgi:NAD-dependent SIR2 family protein deacetylase